MIGQSRDKGGTAASGSQTWKALAGKGKKRIRSQKGDQRRRERGLKALGIALAVIAVLALGAWGIAKISSKKNSLSLATASEPIERIIFDTDGVLPDAWVSSVLRIKPGMRMMEADIHGLKERLESEGQVKRASVERVFPSDLRIRVEERRPVMRMVTLNSEGLRLLRIISDDGEVYRGVNYPKATLSHLPFIEPYFHSNGSPLPLRGIDRVAKLLDLARERAPAIYKGWQVVSLRSYSGDLDLPGQIIEIRSRYVPRILFGASGDLEKQFERLLVILEYVREQGEPSIERIDLSPLESAIVQFSGGRSGTF